MREKGGGRQYEISKDAGEHGKRGGGGLTLVTDP